MRTMIIFQAMLIIGFTLFALFVAEIGFKASIIYALSIIVILIVFWAATVTPRTSK